MVSVIFTSLPLAGMVFWLVSFPMNGCLMPGEWKHCLAYFTLTSALSYYLSPFILKNRKNFDLISRLATAMVILLTISASSINLPAKVLLVLVGLFSVFITFRAVNVLSTSKNPVLSAALALSLGNLCVFLLSNLPIQHSVKFLIISLALTPALLFKTVPSEQKNHANLKRYLAFIFVFYLIGGILYAYITPQYEKVASFTGLELLVYVFSALGASYLMGKKKDIVLYLGILAGALSVSCMLIGKGPFVIAGMFSSQASFGFIDLFILAVILYSGGTPVVTGAGLGTVCLAISAGEALTLKTIGSPLTVIAAGNFILIASLTALHYFTAKERQKKPQKSSALKDADPPSSETISIEFLEAALEGIYEPYQKRLSEKEKDVLLQILKHKTYRQTATELGISESTVKTYMKRIYEKTGARNKDELIEKLFKK